MQPTQQEVQEIFEAHMDTLWTMMEGQVTDIEAFNEWSSKVAAAMTSTTLAFMYPIKKELTQDENTHDWEDQEGDVQSSN